MKLAHLEVLFLNIIYVSNLLKTSRFVVADKQWPGGVVPFQFSEDSGKNDRAAVQFASLQYMYLSCINMVDMNLTVNTKLLSGIDHDGSITFEAGRKDCFAPVGFSNSKRSARCCNAETCLHEIGHILGLEHEHKREDRNYYIHLLFDNIEQLSRTAMLSIHDEQDSGFDFRSVMLYRPTAFSANGESIYRVLDPDQAYLLGIHNSLSYYDVKYVNNLYRCHETQCPTFLRKCRYDGFVLKIGDKCQCYCPPGLDPKRRCANIYKPGKLKARWPTGNYTLPMTGKTCPGEEWLPTSKDHCTPGFVDNSKAPHLNSRPQAFGLREKFCTMPNPIIKRKWRRRSSWESGSYCIVRNGECPLGFQSGFIEIRENHTDIKMTTSNQKSTMNRCEESGILNDYCCRQDGSALKPINLPSTLPFILMMSSIYESCQTVKDMQAYVEEIQYVNQVGFNVTAGGAHPFYYSWEYGISLKYCYYVPLVQDCGELVRLSRWKRSAILTSPNFPDIHENNLSCNWLIKTPLNSIIRLEFLEFSIDGSKDGCPDYVEVRLNMIGQPGVKYCGEFPVRVLLSSSNLMMVTLKTDYEKVKKGFKANVTVVMNSELCYDVEDNGSSYRGSMNITKDFDPCVPWTETTKCRHHAFNSRDETQGVGNHNFCRNPGHGLRPWCYTNASLCTRKYCDACGIAGSYDLIPNCKSLILQNDTFCSRNASAIKLCHSSCKLPFPQTFKNNTESIAFKRQKQKCESPKAINGDILYQTKRSYRVGDEVVIHCHPENLWQQNTSCLSNGQWDIGRVCGICPLHWTYSNGYCYRFFKERVNYALAEKTCQDSHSVVVSPSGSSEFLFMLSLASTEGGVWLGLTFQGNSWLTSTGGKAQWTNWKPGQPDFQEGEEKCARFLTFDDNKWDDVPCDWLKFNAFICKLPAVRVAQCEDASNGCGDFIREFPRFCEENHDFAIQFCSKSCLLCQIKYAK